MVSTRPGVAEQVHVVTFGGDAFAESDTAGSSSRPSA
jgi:hypothetical protein